MDWVGGALVYSTAITDANQANTTATLGYYSGFVSGDNAKVLLQALGLLPTSPDVLSKSNIVTLTTERRSACSSCGGNYRIHRRRSRSSAYRARSYPAIGFRRLCRTASCITVSKAPR